MRKLVFLVIALLLVTVSAMSQAQETGKKPEKTQNGTIFNSSGKEPAGTKPIFMGTKNSQGYQPGGVQAFNPYLYNNSPQQKKITDDAFAAAMASVDAQNLANSDAAAAVRRQYTEAVLAEERARIARMQQLYEQQGKRPEPVDNRKMVYKKKKEQPDGPARLFNVR